MTRATTTMMLAGWMVGCAGVHPIDVHDERLPLEARLWVGGAEDAVAIARAAVQDARLALAEIEAWEDALPNAKQVGPQAAGLVKPLEALADARVTLAEERLERALADLALAEASLDLVYAETDMRYDLGVHDLKDLRDERDAARKSLEDEGADVDEASIALDKAATDFWSAYRAQAAAGGTDPLLWLAVGRR